MLRLLTATVFSALGYAATTPAATARKSTAATEDRPGLVAPTLGGATGLLRLRTAETGPPKTFRIALHSELFSNSNFIVQGDEHTRFVGTATFSFTPTKVFEAYLFLTSAANRNQRIDTDDRRDPEVILALGDFGLGGKTQFEFGRFFSAGGEVFMKFLNAVGGTSLNFASTNVYMGALASLDFARGRGVPLRAHLNAGFLLDQSQELCPPEESDNPCQFAEWDDQTDRLAAEFGYGINRSRAQIALGIDLPFSRLRWPLRPIVEYHIDVATGDADALYEAFFTADNNNDGQPDSPDLAAQVQGRVSQSMTVGLRVRPARGLFVDVGSDLGLQSPGFGFGPSTPPWNVIFGLSYAYDPTPRREVVTREIVKIVEKNKPASPTAVAAPVKDPKGAIRGRLADAVTNEPIEGAVIRFPGRDLTGISSDPDGGFRSYDFAPGEVLLAIRHPKYEPAKQTVVIEADKETALELTLTPAKPAGGLFTGRLVDNRGAAISGGVVRLVGAENKELQTDSQGTFSLELLPGDYVARAEAAGYLSKERKFHSAEGATVAADFVLTARPGKSNVTLDSRKKRIRLAKKIEFEGETLAVATKLLLDEVVDLLVNHPELQRLRVEAHSDNRGDASKLKAQTQNRADAVRMYLVDQGIETVRVEATGFGPTRPVAPNFTASGRAKNRRIELVVTQ